MENYSQIRDNVKDMIYRELDAISNEGQLPYECVHVMHELWEILNEISETEEKEMALEGYGMDGYSSRGRMMRYYDGNSYGNGGYSYNNGRSGNNGSGRMMRSGGYSRDDGRQDMMDKLEKLMNETHDEHVRESIRKMLETR